MSNASDLRAMGLRLMAMADVEEKPGAPSRFSTQRYRRSPIELATEAAHHYALRRERDKFIPKELVGEPTWDMLLELFHRCVKGEELPVTSLCIASGVPNTTALRYLDVLSDRDLIVRRRSQQDRRVAYVSLSAEGYRLMAELMESSIIRTTGVRQEALDKYLRPASTRLEASGG